MYHVIYYKMVSTSLVSFHLSSMVCGYNVGTGTAKIYILYNFACFDPFVIWYIL